MAGLEPSWNGDIAVATLNPQPAFPELYYPLWLYSGSYASINGNTPVFIQKGSTGSATSGSATQLFTLNSNWPASLQYAFEICLNEGSGSGSTYAVNARLYDITASSIVSGSIVTNSTGGFTVLRSGKFTLTPGHTYGVQVYTTNSGYTTYLTDASLIIFPPSPSVSPSLSSISLAGGGGSLKESYYGLWVYSSGSVSSTATVSGNTTFIQKGSTSLGTYNATPAVLKSIGTTWSASQKFALEASILNGTTSDTAHAVLWDVTSNTIVSASQISVTATAATLVRSGSFTLTPGHNYGVSLWCNAGTAYLTKAHLVALAN